MNAILSSRASRGPLLAAAALLLAVTVTILNTRFGSEWGVGIHFLYGLLASALVIALASQTGRPPGPPATWHSTLFVAAYVLALFTLVDLADLLGAEGGLPSSGTTVWVGLLLIVLMAYFATRFDSGISTLLAAVTAVVVAVALIDWVFSPEGTGTSRWVLLVVAIGFGALAVRSREARDHHATGFANAAGVAVLLIALTYAVEAASGLLAAALGGGVTVEAATGWELVILAGGLALTAYAALTRRSGPAYLGVLNLIAFLLIAGGAGDDGPSLIGWPIVLVAATAALLFAALRPEQPVPPRAAGAPPAAPPPA